MIYRDNAPPLAGGRATARRYREGVKPRKVDPVTCERDYDADELEFLRAVDDYRRTRQRPFPTWTEVLMVLKSLGYRKPPADVARTA